MSALKKPQYFQIPIISVGNIVCGGAGKTPTAIALGHLLQERGYKVHFVTRGYGGKEKGPLAVDLSFHKAWDVGDEPLLLAQCAPTWVAKKRSQGVQKAIENGAQLIILDDGHQTARLYKDISFVVIDLLQGFGNGCVIPAGPLREDLAEGIKRADGFIGIGTGELNIHKGHHFTTPHPPQVAISPTRREVNPCLSPTEEKSFGLENASPLVGEVVPKGQVRGPYFNSILNSLTKELSTMNNDGNCKPFFKAQVVAQPLALSSNRIFAFCGLGFPQKFYISLENAGFELVATETFPDHHQYKDDDLLRLSKLARKHNSILVTTRKDLVKIPPPWQDQLYVLDITLEFEDPIGICDFILQKIHPLKGSTS